MSKPVISNTFSLTAIKQGDDGTPGGNTATLFLFKRSATPITAIDWNYALTYNFASQSLSSTPSGWTLNKVPAGTDPVYVTAATAYSTETTDSIAASEWSTPVLYTENTNAATIFLFKRSATAITAHGITSDNVYYKFADGKLYNGTGSSASVISDLNGWTRNIPTDDGKPCYVIQATAVGTGTHDQILHTEWSSVSKLVEDGVSISSADIMFVLSDSGSTAPADNAGWKTAFADLDIKSANASKYVWQATKIVFSNGTTKYTGKQCLGKVSEFASITEQYALGTASAATGTWQDNTPPAAEKGKYLWTRTKLTYSGGGTTYTPSENGQCIGYYGSDGNIGYSIALTLIRNNLYTDANWNTYAELGHSETYSKRTGDSDFTACRVGDYFLVSGTSSDSGISHTAIYKCTSVSANSITGTCVSHTHDGEEGDEGNGIKTVSLYRMFTPTFSAPSSSDSSWASYTDGNTTYVPEKLSSQSNPPKNYLWEKKVTSYTKTNSTTVEIRLVAQIDMGVCANLLQDTAFASDGQMEAWTVRNQYSPVSGQSTPAESGAGEIKTNVTLDGQNSYYDKTAYGTDKLTYKEILQQIIYQTASDGIKKITTSQWYTFSFYVKGYTSGYGNLSTYIYPSCIDTNQAFYIDGVLQSSTPSDGAVNWKVKITTSWVRHSVTFRTKSSISAEQKVLFRLIPESSNTSYNQVWLCMPKLERNSMATEWIENSDDRMADDIQHVYVGNWVSGTTYYYGGGTGVRHVVRAKESANGSMTYWRMKKRTSSAGYTSTTQPYNDTSHWEKANYLKFVATDLLLAEEIIVENLIPTQIHSKNNTFVIDADGNITGNAGTFNNITVESGTIAGFKVSGTGLTNDPFTNDAYVIFRNDARKSFAGIGGNVLPASSGLRAVARFENEDQNNYWGLGANYAMILSAKNADRNYAYAGTGHGVLNGHVVGHQLNDFTPSSSVNTIDPNKGKYVLVRGTYGTCYLPTLSQCRTFLGVSNSTKFAFDLYITAATGASFTLYGYRSASYGANCPHMRNPDDDQDMTGGLGMGKADTAHLLITYDGSNFYAYIMGHLD